MPVAPLPIIKPPWQACVMVCRKCAKKAAGKKGGAKQFMIALKDALRARFGKKHSRLVEVGCLDLCPKGRIAVALGTPAAPLKVVLAKPTSTPEEILATLDTP